jgi:hypothetical protein
MRIEKTLICAMVLTALPFMMGAAAPTDDAATTTRAPSLQDVAFLAGHWQGRMGDDHVEEHWSKPQGDSVMGMFRWVTGGTKASMFEILTITEEAEGLTLRLRHFTPTMVAWEEKDEPMTLLLREASSRRGGFEELTENSVDSISYEINDAGQLAINVVFEEASGRDALRFKLDRVKTD